jgi:uncharacterized OsmC-like protein
VDVRLSWGGVERSRAIVLPGATIVRIVQDLPTMKCFLTSSAIPRFGRSTWTHSPRSPNHRPHSSHRYLLNGVDTPKLFATIGAGSDQPSLAKFQFRARSRWLSGAQCRTTIDGFYGDGGEMQHVMPYVADADHPQILCGEDAAPAPVKWLPHGLAACLTARIANISAARGVTLESVECSVEGDMDLQGILGLSDKVRNGFHAIRVGFRVKGDAPDSKCVRSSNRRAHARPCSTS